MAPTLSVAELISGCYEFQSLYGSSCLKYKSLASTTTIHTMAPIVLPTVLIASAYLLSTVSAAPNVDELVGTWSTKSAAVLTGPVRFFPWIKETTLKLLMGTH